MKIEKYRKLKNDKYKVFLDNGLELTLYEDVILKNNLLLKKQIDNNLIDKLNLENEEEEIYNSCLKYISVRIRSVSEIKRYLENKEVEEDISNAIINRLIKNNYLNDLMFLKYFVIDKINLTNDGPYKIINQLKNHDIDTNLIDEQLYLYQNEFKEKIKKIIEKSIKVNKKYSGFVLKNKIYNNLVNLGYDKSMILSLINNYNFTNDDIKEVYKKLYEKYKNKYDKDKLDLVIKQKLYQKGYSYEDINM